MAAKKKTDDPAAPADKPLEQPAEGDLRDSDRTANAGPGDAEANDPPVRTDQPDVPVLTSLEVGAGAHEPPDPS